MSAYAMAAANKLAQFAKPWTQPQITFGFLIALRVNNILNRVDGLLFGAVCLCFHRTIVDNSLARVKDYLGSKVYNSQMNNVILAVALTFLLAFALGYTLGVDKGLEAASAWEQASNKWQHAADTWRATSGGFEAAANDLADTAKKAQQIARDCVELRK